MKPRTYLKLTAGLLLFGTLVVIADVGEIVATLKKVSLVWFVLGTGLVVLDQAFMGAKWNILLRALGVRPPFFAAIIAYFRGGAFKYIVPSTIGIDGYKVYYIAKRHGSRADVLASVLVERFFGAISSLLFVTLSVYFVVRELGVVEHSQLVALCVLGFVLGILGVGVLFALMGRIDEVLEWKIVPRAMARRLRNTFGSIASFRRKRGSLVSYLALSVFEKVFYGMTIYTCVRSLGGEGIPLVYVVAATPIMALLERIPISVSSLGVREGIFVTMLLPFGVEAAQSLAVAVVLRTMEAVQIGIMCFVWFVGDKEDANAGAIQDVLSSTRPSTAERSQTR